MSLFKSKTTTPQTVVNPQPRPFEDRLAGVAALAGYAVRQFEDAAVDLEDAAREADSLNEELSGEIARLERIASLTVAEADMARSQAARLRQLIGVGTESAF